MQLFYDTHSLTTTFDGAFWQRTSLPGPGSVSEQDHRTMELLQVVCRLQNDALSAEKKPKRRRDRGADEMATFKRRRRE